MLLEAVIIEAEYGPQPYDPAEGGPAVFRGRLKNAGEADSVDMVIQMLDELGQLMAELTAPAQKDPNSDDWCFLVAMWPTEGVASSGYVAPTFKAQVRVGENIYVIVQDICNGMQILWRRRKTDIPPPPPPPLRPIGGRVGEAVGSAVAGALDQRDINCNTHPWLPHCWPWRWSKDPRLDKPPGNPDATGDPPPDNRPKPVPPRATPNLGSMLVPGNSTGGEGPGGICPTGR